jgi:hypothetical protein
VILFAVGWYLRFSLSYRDVEELLAERGLHPDHLTVRLWIQRYAKPPFLLPPQLEVVHFNRNFQARCDPIIFAKAGGEFTAFEQVAV